jgi:MFS family permease
VARADASSRTAPERFGRVTVSRTAGFWLATVVFVLVFAVSAAPTPLYGVYQTEWRFSAIVLTAIFAIYAVFLLIALLIFGSVSDHVERRRVISVALLGNAAACALFLSAHGVAQLFAARAVQGLAVGLATSALGATLIDLQPEGSGLAPVFTNAGPLWGLAVGAVGASALVQYAPAPTHLIWWLLLGTSFAAALAILTMPETSAGRPNVLASLRPSVGIPRQARGTFARTAPILVAAWAVNGFYLSLGPSLVGDVLRSRNVIWGGLAIFVLTALAGIAAVVARAWSARTTMVTGCTVLVAGATITFAGIATKSAGVFLAGIAVAGVGVGMSFLGSFRVLSALATPGQRASLISSIFILAYTAFSLPVVIAGIATSRFGLHATGLAYCAAVAVIAAVALVSLFLHGRAATGTPVPVLTTDRPIANSSKCGV